MCFINISLRLIWWHSSQLINIWVHEQIVSHCVHAGWRMSNSSGLLWGVLKGKSRNKAKRLVCLHCCIVVPLTLQRRERAESVFKTIQRAHIRFVVACFLSCAAYISNRLCVCNVCVCLWRGYVWFFHLVATKMFTLSSVVLCFCRDLDFVNA